MTTKLDAMTLLKEKLKKTVFSKADELFEDVIEGLKKDKSERTYWDDVKITDLMKDRIEYFKKLKLKSIEIKEVC
jgi:hypothetical protein